MKDSYGTRALLQCGQQQHHYCDLRRLPDQKALNQLPFTLRVLLDNLLRHEDGTGVTQEDIDALLHWDPQATPHREVAFTPARVLLQDFTGVPAVVDLAAMRDAMRVLGKDPLQINPLRPVELVIDHSVMVDAFNSADSVKHNTDREFERNLQRYAFLRWGQKAFKNFKVVPPGQGIVHQVNLEYLARVVFEEQADSAQKESISWLYPDTVVGTDSHTTMINGLGVLGWGVGGIEAEAAMLGQPISMLIPQVVGVQLTGRLPEGTTATDLVLTVTQTLRSLGVVGQFVEFFGEGLSELSLADRATIANMSPEYGATCGYFPIDEVTLSFLKMTGRSEEHIERIRAYTQATGLFWTPETPAPHYSRTVTVDLSSIEPSIAGPKRPQDRIPLRQAKEAFAACTPHPERVYESTLEGKKNKIPEGAVVIAAITSCTNTSNPAVMLAAGLVAQKARARGLTRQPWVKTSLAPGSQVVTDYLARSKLQADLDALGFYHVGYGCTTCIGNSGPLSDDVQAWIDRDHPLVAAVLSGNRNFEGRIHPSVQAAYLASPPLVVAYALCGTMNHDFAQDPIGHDPEGQPVFLSNLWPSSAEIQALLHEVVRPEMFAERYAHVFEGTEAWKNLPTPEGLLFDWDDVSTYIQKPPYFNNLTPKPQPLASIEGARMLALLGDSVTTDHISPAGAIASNSPAGQYLLANKTAPEAFNSYGSRRGNHEVMMRGTFANIRLRNQLAPGTEGGFTTHYGNTPSVMTIFEAAMAYAQEKTPLIVVAGKEYGSGSSRDWAAKGPQLLGVKVVIAQSYERIHRSNLVGMGVLPLEFLHGESAQSLGLCGEDQFAFDLTHLTPKGLLTVQIHTASGAVRTFETLVRIDTPAEMAYMEHGGILSYVLRQRNS